MAMKTLRAPVSIADARNHLTRLVRDVERSGPVPLSRRGKPVAVLISLDAYRELSGERTSFWSALTRFRRGADVAAARIEPDNLRHLRDRAPGRSPAW
jgi:antitoxin Phd